MDTNELKEKVAEVQHKVTDKVLEVNDMFEDEIDPWLMKWAHVRYSGWLGVGFGTALLAIGALLGKIFW